MTLGENISHYKNFGQIKIEINGEYTKLAKKQPNLMEIKSKKDTK